MTDAPLTPVERLLTIRENAVIRGANSGSLVLAELLTRLQVPASLKGGRRVAIQACRLLCKSIRTQPPDALPKIHEYICELWWVIHRAKRLAVFLFDCGEERKSFLHCFGGNPYVSDGALDHGLCCLLWEKYPTHVAQPDVVDRNRRLNDHHLKGGGLTLRLKVACLRLKPLESFPAESRLKARSAL